MESLTFTPGDAFLSSDSHAVPWSAVFEDEGDTGYFYACDRSREKLDDSILDGMLVYNVRSIEAKERIVSIEWSRDGMKAVLYLDGVPQAMADFGARRGYCRANFPNFLAEQGDVWDRSSHEWSDAVMAEFEAALYV